jgi:3-methyladenine DNA glycosylase AlkD
MKSALDDPGRPSKAAEVAENKQEWEICDIVVKEVVDRVPHYRVQWSVTLVPISEMWNTALLGDDMAWYFMSQREHEGHKGFYLRYKSPK